MSGLIVMKRDQGVGGGLNPDCHSHSNSVRHFKGIIITCSNPRSVM